MNLLGKINTKIFTTTKWASIVLFMVMLSVASLQILMRFVFKSPLAWTDEISKYSFVWGTMLGCAYLVRTNGHSSVEVLAGVLRGGLRKGQKIVVESLCLLLYVIITTGGITMMQAGATTKTPALGWPMHLVYLILPLSGVFMVLFGLENLIKSIITKE